MAKRRRYVVVARVAEGSMGTVWRARQPELDRMVAIKELSPDVAGNADALKHLVSQSDGASAFDHPNLVAAHDYFEKDGKHWFVQEWVEGQPLDELVARAGRLSPQQAVGVAMAVLRGLAHVHDRGLAHGDVRRGNVFVGTDGTPKLGDFGLNQAGTADAAGDVRDTAALLVELLTESPSGHGDPDGSGGRHGGGDKIGGVGRRLDSLLRRAVSEDAGSPPADAHSLLAQLEQEAQRRFGRDWEDHASLAPLVAAAHEPGPRVRNRKVAALITLILLVLGTSVIVVAQRRGERVTAPPTAAAPGPARDSAAAPTPAELAGADISGTFRVTKKVQESSNLVGPSTGNLEATYVIGSDCSVNPCRYRLQVRETGLDAPLQREGDDYKLTLRSTSDCVDPTTGAVQLQGGANATLALTLRPTAASRGTTGWVASALAGSSVFTVESASPGACDPPFGLERATLEGVRS